MKENEVERVLPNTELLFFARLPFIYRMSERFTEIHCSGVSSSDFR
jgi:hypothetical protein